MKTCQELMNDSKTKLEKEAKARRMKTCRELMNESKKKEEKEANAKNHKATRKRKMVEDSEGFKENQRNQRKRLREIEKANCGRLERLRKFRHAIKYGAIFVCSSCHQRLFENGVTLITNKFAEDVEGKKPGLFKDCITEEEQFIKKKSGSYICHTCKVTMKKGKMPCMSVKNGLLLMKLAHPSMKLSEIENNLIAQNILFQKIFLLPKSRMSAVKDRLVNVPVSAADVINTVKSIPRTPQEAGLIQVRLKRRLKFKNYHQQEYIDPKKIFGMLEHLKKSGHPYYQSFDNFNTYRKRCKTNPKNQNLKSPRKVKLQFVSETETEAIIDLNRSSQNNEHLIPHGKEEEPNCDSDEEEQYVKKDPIRKFQLSQPNSTSTSTSTGVGVRLNNG